MQILASFCRVSSWNKNICKHSTILLKPKYTELDTLPWLWNCVNQLREKMVQNVLVGCWKISPESIFIEKYILPPIDLARMVLSIGLRTWRSGTPCTNCRKWISVFSWKTYVYGIHQWKYDCIENMTTESVIKLKWIEYEIWNIP